VLARTDAESAQKETSLAREMAASQAKEDVVAAAGAWPRHLLVRCWHPPLGGGLLPGSPSEARPGSAEGGNNAEGAAAPPADAQTCRNSLSVACACFFVAAEA
jgi:hypothetical protein